MVPLVTVLGQAKRHSRALSVASLGESVPSGRALFGTVLHRALL